jgi:hypothetical protein
MPAHFFSNERNPSMITITEILNAIEAHAARHRPRASPHQEGGRETAPVPDPDDQDHADALLLKLDRLLSDQVV